MTSAILPQATIEKMEADPKLALAKARWTKARETYGSGSRNTIRAMHRYAALRNEWLEVNR